MTAVLARLQRDFVREVFDDRGSDPGIAVYRSSVLANYRGALAAAYPVVARLVGDAFFAEAARRYALTHASTSGDLSRYGGTFADFLAAYAPAASLGYLADVARLEWACHECGRAEPAPAFDFAALARVPADRYAGLRFRIDPGVRLVASAYPIVAIHEANAPHRDGTPSRDQGAEFALVRRVEGSVRIESIPAAEWRFLDTLARAETFERAASGLDEGEKALVTSTLARYVAAGVVCGFSAA